MLLFNKGPLHGAIALLCTSIDPGMPGRLPRNLLAAHESFGDSDGSTKFSAP